MTKMHTRIKRALCLTTTHQHCYLKKSQKNGKRTFKTEAAALAYAKENKLSTTLVKVKKGKRFQLA